MLPDNVTTKAKDILGCSVKDESGLNDFQKMPAKNAIKIPYVGIERFRLPVLTQGENGLVNHNAEASMFVELASGKTGVNMSRFCSILQEEAMNGVMDKKFFKRTLSRFRKDLRDEVYEDLISKACLEISFDFPMKQKSLKSDLWGWQYYPVTIKAEEDSSGKISMVLKVDYEYSSTCPCSLSMAKQYEEDYRLGKTTEGNGIATAHSQRSRASVSVHYDYESEVGIEKVIGLLRKALPTETQSMVKRRDEQAFAILNGENPMFVEHASRRLSAVLDSIEDIYYWEAKVEHFESLHSHNAVAMIFKELKPESSDDMVSH